MEFLDEIINTVGRQTVIIICIALIVLIAGVILSRMFRLRNYKKAIVEIENRMNAIKTLPIQYRLGRVKGIAKNMPNVQEKYDDFLIRYDEINEFLNNDLLTTINDLDEAIFTRHLKGVRKKIPDLETMVAKYEKDSKQLLSDIEIITEIENVQRLEIIKLKEKYRRSNDLFSTIRLKIETFVPAIPDSFEAIDKKFVQLEDLMNSQLFEQAKQLTSTIDKDIDQLDAALRDLPTYISIVRKYIPKRIREIDSIIEEMTESDYSIERLNTTIRYNKIVSDLNTAIENIKALNLENVGQTLEVITEEINDLASDFDKEKAAFKKYAKHRDECFDMVFEINKMIENSLESLKTLRENYVLDNYNITLEEDTKLFKDVLTEISELKIIIESGDFSYLMMTERFEEIMDECKPYRKSVDDFLQLEKSLNIEEKRALDELENINIVLLEIKSEIKNKHLPTINDSYKDYIQDSYQKAEAILGFIKHRPIDLDNLMTQVDAARDVIYKLYDNVHNLIVTAEMVEDAIVFGNRYRSDFLEVNTELTKSELLFRNGEYTKALSTAVDIIEKIKPGSYEMLINKMKPKKARES